MFTCKHATFKYGMTNGIPNAWLSQVLILKNQSLLSIPRNALCVRILCMSVRPPVCLSVFTITQERLGVE